MPLVISRSVTTLEELLLLNNESFIHSAYQTILGRAPDKEGMQYYIKRLKADVSKIEILAQLRISKEGISRPLNIAGLNEAVKRHKQLKTPLLGSLLRLAGVKQLFAGTTNLDFHKIETNNSQNYIDLLNNYGIREGDMPQQLDLEIIRRNNPYEHFDSIYDAVTKIVVQSPAQKISIFDNNELNAKLYVKLGLNQEALSNKEPAIELYKLSLLFKNTPQAHEHLGNFALKEEKYCQAILHYEIALGLKNRSIWVYLNLAHAQAAINQYDLSVCTIYDCMKQFPRSEILFSKLDNYIHEYWTFEEQKLDGLASSQNIDELILEYERITAFISDYYLKIFTINSLEPVNNCLNSKKVLIVGLAQNVLPQCFRYRMEQKIEQLQFAGYQAESVLWSDYDSTMNLINFYDLIIFYRVPAFPEVLKLISYARSLGKITFYELDDLLCESFSVPAIDTYGGQISIATYTNLIKDIGYHRSAASKCDYAIASTLPLLERLAPLTTTQLGFLHRNGLDKYNVCSHHAEIHKGYLNLFYGSGTLAHNSDFIVEALPAISHILKEYSHVKLTVVGNLELPATFLQTFKAQVIQVPLIRNIEAYWTYLAASDINLAVLHDDTLAGCKSELKWFEAATFAIPSIVSKTRNYLDVIKHGEDGFVVSGEHEWYDSLRQLIENPELRQLIGKNAQTRVVEEYSVSALAKNIDRLMQQAVANHSKSN